jgi:hypothetical protein
MATCALLGQAVGTAAACAIRYQITPQLAATNYIREIQKTLMDDGVFLPHHLRLPSTLTQAAHVNLSDEERALLFNGIERPRTTAGENAIQQNPGASLCFSWDTPQQLSTLRLRFDPDFERFSISDNKKMRVYAMKLHTGKDFHPVRVANTIVKSFVVYADGVEIARMDNNFQSLVQLPLNCCAKSLRIVWLRTHGAETVRLFSADIV